MSYLSILLNIQRKLYQMERDRGLWLDTGVWSTYHLQGHAPRRKDSHLGVCVCVHGSIPPISTFSNELANWGLSGSGNTLWLFCRIPLLWWPTTVTIVARGSQSSRWHPITFLAGCSHHHNYAPTLGILMCVLYPRGRKTLVSTCDTLYGYQMCNPT